MAFIHERLSKGQWVAPWLRHQNLARYAWGAQYVAGKAVAEIGCGGGHGTKRFADAGAKSVIGFDIMPDAIASANESWASSRLSFELASSERFQELPQAFDLVAAFETIEHVEDYRGFVQEIAGLLKADGTFLCSTPNRALTNPATTIHARPFNRHHVREFDEAELREILSEQFEHVDLLGQAFYSLRYCQLLTLMGRGSPRLAVRVHQLQKLARASFESKSRHDPQAWASRGKPEVLVAVCAYPRRAVRALS